MEALRPGDPDRIDGYRLLARLGSGAMGQVFLARSATGAPVAIKIVHADLTRADSFRERFRRAVTAARAVSGAFTVPVVDAGPDAPRPWLCTAYLPGPTLQEAVTAHGPWPAPAVYALGAGLAAALISIHRAGLVHRDLKPSNVLLGPDGPRVIDFGIAHVVLTRPGRFLGSPGYVAPEQATGGVAGVPGDVFSFGAVLAFAGTGSGPFGEAPPHALVHRVVHEPPRLDAVRDPALRNLIAVCLDKQPGRRPLPAWLLDGLAALVPPDTVLNGTSWLPPAVGAEVARGAATARALCRPVVPGPSRRGLVALGALGTGVLAAGGGTAVALLRSAPDPRRAGPAGRPSAPGAAPAASTARLAWKRYTGSTRAAAPVVAGGVVYVGAGNGRLLALDAGDGRIRWRMRAGARIVGAPVPSGGIVYATGLDHSVYAVDARSGAVRWRFRPGPVLGGATVLDGILCVGTDGHGFYGLSAATGTVRWRHRAGDRPAGLPAAIGRMFCLPTDQGVTAVDARTGRVRWRSPAGHGGGDLVAAAGTVYCRARHGRHPLYALDAATGARRWTYPGGASTDRPLAAGGSVFAGDSGGGLYALDAVSGAPRWRSQPPGGVSGTPVLAGRDIVVTSGPSGDGRVHAVDAGTGRAAWSYLIRGGLEPGPAAHGGDVYVSGRDGYVYALTGGGATTSP
ncbi:PQQ-binding-like beta-propeller repeat protein [Actinomadura scrupuli]|uniref:outer membrane protein assembly factor BamB family protein n=1 Tax=Actinomadura scrupuli TaxID=559629 RepID=UPI003D955DC1